MFLLGIDRPFFLWSDGESRYTHCYRVVGKTWVSMVNTFFLVEDPIKKQVSHSDMDAKAETACDAKPSEDLGDSKLSRVFCWVA